MKSEFLVPSIYLLFVVRPMELNGPGKYTTQTVMNVGFRPSSSTLHFQSYGEFVVCQVERGHKWVNFINSWNLGSRRKLITKHRTFLIMYYFSFIRKLNKDSYFKYSKLYSYSVHNIIYVARETLNSILLNLDYYIKKIQNWNAPRIN